MRLVPLLLGGLLAAADPVTVPLALQPTAGHGPFCEASIELDAKGEGSFRLAWADGQLRCRRSGESVFIDRNGDGRIDDADGPAIIFGAEVGLRLATCTGDYLIRFSAWDDTHLRIECRSALVAMVDGERIAIYDHDVDGRFDGVGVDQVIRGPVPTERAWDAARPLMPVMAFAGDLRHVACDGHVLRLAPWEGPVVRLTVAVADGPNPLGLPAAHATALTLQHRDGQMEVIATSDAATLLVPGAYILAGERLSLTNANPERKPYLFSPGTHATLSFAAGEQRLERRLPERLTLGGCVLQATELELDPPALVAGDGTAYVPVVYGLMSEECPKDPLSLAFRLGERRSEPFNLAYG